MSTEKIFSSRSNVKDYITNCNPNNCNNDDTKEDIIISTEVNDDKINEVVVTNKTMYIKLKDNKETRYNLVLFIMLFVRVCF